MIKHAVALVVLSIIVVLTMSYAQQAVQFLLNGHEWISQALTDVFSGGQTGNTLRGLIALLSVPFIVGFVVATLYYAVRRHWFPYFMQTVWAVWLVQAGALVIMYKAVVL